MTKAKTITKNILEDNYVRRILLRVLLIGLASLFVVYLYLIGSITFNILARKTFETKAQFIVNQVSQLELEYLEKTGEINKDFALTRGFVDANQSIFATRPIKEVAIR